jgi:predicted nuclease of predicted toxin-antitoxin system
MFRLDVAKALRKEGYDVVRASETGLSRADDEEILQRAVTENRILITLDEHFGDRAVLPLSVHPGVIRLKVHPATSQNIIALLSCRSQGFTRESSLRIVSSFSRKNAKWVHTA